MSPMDEKTRMKRWQYILVPSHMIWTSWIYKLRAWRRWCKISCGVTCLGIICGTIWHLGNLKLLKHLKLLKLLSKLFRRWHLAVWTADTSKIVETVKISETTGVYTFFYHTHELSSETDLLLRQNTRANHLPLGSKHAKIWKQMILPWDINTPK